MITSANNETRTRYSDEELKEFEILINEKLVQSKEQLSILMESLTRKNDSGTDSTSGGAITLDDGSDVAEKEALSQMAGRQHKFIQQLEQAMIRIKKGTYGICVDSGVLIPKERLRLVPHTQHSVEAKLKRGN
jgi:RNA polymerase-binding transcription factor DksA